MRLSAGIVLVGLLLVVLGTCSAQGAVALLPGWYSPFDFGAKADAKTDCTAAIQQAIDQAAAAGGGVVYLPPGHYLVSGSLSVKPGVTVKGANQAPQYIDKLTGTVIFATGGRDKPEGPALFELGNSATVRDLSVFYPDQRPTDIHPYPFTFHLVGGDNTVEDITLYNSFNGISVGPQPNVRHRLLWIYGCVLNRGIVVDSTTDIGRIENVQFHCHWWSSKAIGGDWDPVFKYMTDHCEGFVFGRTDWEYVANTFIFPAKIGYHFVKTEKGVCNGNFSGIGADATQNALVVDDCFPWGVLVSNGEFVSFAGDHPTAIVVKDTNTGSLNLVNCAVWGPSDKIADLAGSGRVSMENCNFMGWSSKGKQPVPAIQVAGGTFKLVGCSLFGPHAPDAPHVLLEKDVRAAVIFGNTTSTPFKLINHSPITPQVGFNTVEIAPPAPQQAEEKK